MARGVEGRVIFIDDLDRTKFLEDMELISAQSSAEIIAWCLMNNHFHLAIKIDQIPLSSIMHRMMGGHAGRFNGRHDRKGHLFQGRHKANLCTDDLYLRRLIRYIHMNPVRAGLVATPEDWPWSSARKIGTPTDDGVDFDPWAKGPILLRTIERVRVDLAEIAESVAKKTGIGADYLRSRSREARLVAARKSLSTIAIGEGHSIKAIAEWLGTHPSSVSRHARM